MTTASTDSRVQLSWSARFWRGVERVCLEVGHRLAAVGFLVLVVGIVTRAVGKDAWLMFPVAFGCADVSLVTGLIAWTIASRRGTRRREALAMILFSLAVVMYAGVMLVKLRAEAGGT